MDNDTTVAASFGDETVQSLIELGRQTAGPKTVETFSGSKVPYFIHQGKVTLCPEIVFNSHAERPERLTGTVTVVDPASFCEYFNLFSDGNSRVFADEATSSVLAVLDYHESGTQPAPRYAQHRLKLGLQPSEEWKIWTGGNNKRLNQQQFAEFLEQYAVDITTPAPAAIREIAEDLEATVEVEFASAQKMAGGKVNLKYTETTKTTVSGGKQIQVPDAFKISIPVYVGANRQPVDVLLRYRIEQQKLMFFYTLVRPDEIRRTAFIEARTQIANALELTIINGVPA